MKHVVITPALLNQYFGSPQFDIGWYVSLLCFAKFEVGRGILIHQSHGSRSFSIKRMTQLLLFINIFVDSVVFAEKPKPNCSFATCRFPLAECVISCQIIEIIDDALTARDCNTKSLTTNLNSPFF